MKYIGIDLGTTYSCVTLLDEEGGSARPLPNIHTRASSTPSVVYYGAEDIIVGEDAKMHLMDNKPGHIVAIEESKRYLGIDGKFWEVEINGKTVKKTPQDVAEDILRWLKNNIEEFKDLSASEFKCMVTVPASYNEKQKQLVRDAAKAAGLGKDVEVRPEPTAAAAAYIVEHRDVLNSLNNGYMIVFDLGGGTLDVSLVDIGKYSVVNAVGFPKLGGKDWDAEIISDIYRRYSALQGITVDDLDEATKYYITADAEKIKKSITGRDMDAVIKNTLMIKSANFDYSLTRRFFTEITKWRMDLAMDCIDLIIEESKSVYNVDVDKIKKVLLVGGSSRMDQVRESIVEKYPQFKGKTTEFDPDTAISKGATYILEGKRCKILDILSHTIGVEIYRGDKLTCSNLLYRNSILEGELTATDTFVLRNDDQRSVSLPTHWNETLKESNDSEFTDLENCKGTLGTLNIQLAKPGKKGDPVHVEITMFENGTGKITAECNGVKKTEELRFDSS